MKITQLLNKSKRELKEISPCPYQESLWILESVFNLSANNIYIEKKTLSSKEEQIFWNKIYKRKEAYPLAYILKEKPFFKNKFYVEEGCFIPRPETQTLVKWLIKNIPSDQELKAVDFGAGAGTLCLSLLSHFTNSQWTAIEIDRKSIQCLKKNSISFKVFQRLNILKKDVSRLCGKDFNLAPSLITANPPYIDPKDKETSPGVYLFEPPLALFSDQEGLGCTFSWFKKAMELLAPKGIYIFELAWNKEEQVRKFCEGQRELKAYHILKDQLGHPRIAVCLKK